MAHWYKQDGTPFYEVPYAGKREGTRPAHIGDARKVGAFPSVTAIIAVPDKPGLRRYFSKQDILAAFEWMRGMVKRVNGVRRMSYWQMARFIWTALRTWDVPDWAFKEMQVIARRHAKEAADRGSDIHDAIERAFKLGAVKPDEHYETVTAVLDLVQEMCGPQEWGAEKWFAHPLGFGGKIDLISDEWVIDFKTKPGEASEHKMYDDQLMQLVAYDYGTRPYDAASPITAIEVGVGLRPGSTRRKANVIVSRDIPGSVAWWSWDGADEEKAWDEFCLLLQFWQSRNNYWPHLEQAA